MTSAGASVRLVASRNFTHRSAWRRSRSPRPPARCPASRSSRRNSTPAHQTSARQSPHDPASGRCPSISRSTRPVTCLGDVLADECLDFDSVNDSLELADLLKDLNQHERRMLWLRFVDGRTQREIAELMGMSQMMVSRRLGVLVEDLRARAGRTEVA